MTEIVFGYEFVKLLPPELKAGVIYVSLEYGTVAHLCACGCGSKVVTPITPMDWKLVFDGKTISLHPSIGSWSLPCRSHYWIRRNRILWAPRWSQARMQRARHARALGSSSLVNPTRSSLARISSSKETSVWSILRKWWLR